MIKMGIFKTIKINNEKFNNCELILNGDEGFVFYTVVELKKSIMDQTRVHNFWVNEVETLTYKNSMTMMQIVNLI